MPIAIFKTVREVSSEDSGHVAANLIKDDSTKKWKTKEIGEKSAYIILEFEEPNQITGIDIGNEHSAFIEVLVSNTGCHPDDFKPLLLSSTFMSLTDSKNSTNKNRVRCFSTQALDPPVLSDKWKLVKVICTQPFNRYVRYGLSFIKVHVTGNNLAVVNPTSVVPEKKKSNTILSMGQFKYREDSPDSDVDGRASSVLFNRWMAARNDDNTPSSSTAAAIRDAGTSASFRRLSENHLEPIHIQSTPSVISSSSDTAGEIRPLDRNRNSLLFGDDNSNDSNDDEPGVETVVSAKMQRISKHLLEDRKRRQLELEELEKKKKRKSGPADKQAATTSGISTSTPSTLSTSLSVSSSGASSAGPSNGAKATNDNSQRGQKRPSTSAEELTVPAKKLKPDAGNILYRPFNALLRGVVLVISGIQNPERAELRSKALAMGAKYKADWEAGCTHLICAFKNTPKYNQVAGHGKIVNPSWINKCHALRKYLPWRRYALDTAESANPESDDEILEESAPSIAVNDDLNADGDRTNGENSRMDEEFEVDNINETATQHGDASGPDTEDELERVAQENQALSKDPNENTTTGNVFEQSTDEEEYLKVLRN